VTMKTAAFFVMMILPLAFATGSAQAFQVYTPDQLENGIGVRGGVGFKDTMAEPNTGPKFEFRASTGMRGNDSSMMFGGRSSDYTNWYGRKDTGGRSYGDQRNSNYQSCTGSDSQVGMLNSFGGGTSGAYPCQRFR
jgi:hypothetical protein